MGKHADKGALPGMVIAFHAEEQLGTIEGLDDWFRSRSLCLIPLRIEFRRWVRVVLRRIVAKERHTLSRADTYHARNELALLALQYHFGLRDFEAMGAQRPATSHVHDNILQPLIAGEYVVG